MRAKPLVVVLGVAALVVLLDQLSKAWAVATLMGQPSVEVLGTLLQFTFVRNTGAAFGIGTGMTWLFSLIAVAVVIVIIRTSRTLDSWPWALALGGLLGGALGNLIDRLTREPGLGRGYVVDFIQIPMWPVFNVADIAITCSAITMIALSLFGVHMRRAPASEQPT